MLCVVSEDTERVIAERRMATLRDLGADPTHASAARPRRSPRPRRHLAGTRDLPVHARLPVRRRRDRRPARDVDRVEPGHPAAPPSIRLDDPDPVWPAAEVAAGASVVVGDLDERFPGLPTGGWQEPPAHALVVPIPQQGQRAPVRASSSPASTATARSTTPTAASST